jgi:hypothetical protein
MVKGIDQFKAHFAGHKASYALIGGAACDLLFGDAGLPFRATKDFDMVLCVEVVDRAFADMFAGFLDAGGYEARERSTGRREFYRFHRPKDNAYPAMIELFARKPGAITLPDTAELTPIPVEEDVISLSAILLDDDYYAALQDGRRILDGVSLVDETVLVPFKARAFLDLCDRQAACDMIDGRHAKKHCSDVFRLVQLLPGTGERALPVRLRNDLKRFVAAAETGELPEPRIGHPRVCTQRPSPRAAS